MNTMLQQRTQHIQDLKFALDKQKSAYNAHIDTISHDITTEREYYQQTIDNLTKQIAWQQQTLNEQRNQLHLARFVMPLILLAHRIRKTFQRA
jgi:DNA replication protein DnaD